jgi:hypothetical protein
MAQTIGCKDCIHVNIYIHAILSFGFPMIARYRLFFSNPTRSNRQTCLKPWILIRSRSNKATIFHDEGSFWVQKPFGPRSRVARWPIFKPKISTWVNLGGYCNGRCLYIICLFGLFWGHFVYFGAIWYISWPFGTFSPVLVCCTNKNLATPPWRRTENSLKAASWRERLWNQLITAEPGTHKSLPVLPQKWKGLSGLPDFSLWNVPKRWKNIPNDLKITISRVHKIYQINIIYIYQMAIKYINIFHCNSLQNIPKVVFLVWKYTIWQPIRSKVLLERIPNTLNP